MTTPPAAHTATFLMTDIAGSTRLWEEHRDLMDRALAEHDAMLRAAVEEAGGTVFKTTGDGLLAAFERPGAAVRAAIAGQRAIAAQAWPTPEPIVVRMAVHSGDAEVRDNDYFGPSLNRVARLLSIGHGGQILVSAAGAALAADDLPDGVTLLDRGEHHLKDLIRPERVYQLAAPGLAADFPPLRSGAAPTNLPASLTSFIGREREAAEIDGLLRRHRLVTLVGVGGTGKTRLMLHVGGEVAGRHPDGTWLVELAPLREPALVVQELARTLGVQASPGQPVIAAVADFLRDKDLLVLLDNCEHLIGAAAELAERLLAGCPSLQLLATSREGLGIPGEATYAVPSLGVPDRLDELDLAAVGATEAVRLFLERATTTLPEFRLDETTAAAVVEICRRLDGIPLALELAAARVNVLSAEEIAQGLGDRFRLLTGGRRTAVPRQQTLKALIDWSWDLLDEVDQRLLERVSVFAGGWTLEAAAAITSDQGDPAAAPTSAARLDTLDGLGRLVDRSLVVVTHAGATRYGVLETIRQYATDRLVADDAAAAALRARHLARFRRLALDAEAGLQGPDMVAWIGRVEAELDNVRAALDWAFEADQTAALEMCVALSAYWRTRTTGREGVDRLRQAADVVRRLRSAPSHAPAPSADRAVLEARLMVSLEFLLGMAGMAARSSIADEALAIAREAGDPATLVDALMATVQSAILASGGVATEAAMSAAAEALEVATRMGQSGRIANVWWGIGMVMVEAQRDPGTADVWLERATDAARSSGNPWAIAAALQVRGRVLAQQGREEEARRWFTEAQTAFEAIGDTRFAWSAASEFAHSLRRSGAVVEADARYRITVRGWAHTGNRGAVANQLESLAFTALFLGHDERAARLLGAAEAIREASGDPMSNRERLEYDAKLDSLRGRLDAEAFGRQWAAGRGMTTSAAVEYAASG